MNEHDRKDDVEPIVRSAGRRPAVPAEIADRVRANVHEAWRSEVDATRTRRRFMVAVPLAAAAAIATIVVYRPEQVEAPRPAAIRVATVERVTGPSALSSGQTILAGSSISTESGARAAIRLSNQTSVRVDSSTQIAFKNANEISLKTGAVYVDTAHSGIRITTPFGVVRDVGTKFEVRVTDQSARIRVREGEVVVSDRSAHRGEQLELSAGGAIAMSRVPTWGDDWGWLNEIAPAYAVDGKRVAEFLTWVSGESGVDVRYDSSVTSQKAANVVLHGSIGTLPPLAAADSVLPTAGLRAEVKEGVMTVRRQ